MISSIEEKQIDDYLILSKLPLDILLEVRDHMISQVSDLQFRENISFEKAFFKTKIAWELEFKMTNYFFFYIGEISVLEKKIVKSRYNSILKKALIITFLLFVINLLTIYVSENQEFYGVLFKIQNGLILSAPIALWLLHYEQRKFFRTDYKYKGKLFYTMYQQNITLLTICLSSCGQLVMHTGGSAFQFFRTDLPIDIVPVLLTLFIPMIIHAVLIFGTINLVEHYKTLEKLQNFIKVSDK